jgi:hypothetical protein
VAVGGSFFPPGVGGRPWSDSPTTALREFWQARDAWMASWEAGGPESCAFAIDSVRVWQTPPTASSAAGAGQGGGAGGGGGRAPTVFPRLWGTHLGGAAAPVPRGLTGAGSGDVSPQRGRDSSSSSSSWWWPFGGGAAAARAGERASSADNQPPAVFVPPGQCLVRFNLSADLYGDCAGVRINSTSESPGRHGPRRAYEDGAG